MMGAKRFRAVNCEMSKDEQLNNKQMFRTEKNGLKVASTGGSMMEELAWYMSPQSGRKGNKKPTKDRNTHNTTMNMNKTRG